MGKFILGFLVCLILVFPSAKALDIQMTNITVRDMFAASALAGILSSGSILSADDKVEYSFRYADLMMRRRNK